MPASNAATCPSIPRRRRNIMCRIRSNHLPRGNGNPWGMPCLFDQLFYFSRASLVPIWFGSLNTDLAANDLATSTTASKCLWSRGVLWPPSYHVDGARQVIFSIRWKLHNSVLEHAFAVARATRNCEINRHARRVPAHTTGWQHSFLKRRDRDRANIVFDFSLSRRLPVIKFR